MTQDGAGVELSTRQSHPIEAAAHSVLTPAIDAHACA
jgi:hypothetical protein